MIYRIESMVEKLEHKTRALRAFMDPDNANEVIWEREDIGWFVTFEGSHESLFVGFTEPKDLQPGTKVNILIYPHT